MKIFEALFSGWVHIIAGFKVISDIFTDILSNIRLNICSGLNRLERAPESFLSFCLESKWLRDIIGFVLTELEVEGAIE